MLDRSGDSFKEICAFLFPYITKRNGVFKATFSNFGAKLLRGYNLLSFGFPKLLLESACAAEEFVVAYEGFGYYSYSSFIAVHGIDHRWQ